MGSIGCAALNLNKGKNVASDPVIVSPVAGKADLKAFIDLPFRLYANDLAWVPPLRAEVRELLTPGKNPFFEHADPESRSASSSSSDDGEPMAHGL